MNFLGIIKNGTKKKAGLYMPSLFPASRTTYDNTQSGLSANRTQGAIDELCTTVNSKVSDEPTFTEANTRANIASGESFSTILGKIKKFFSDLKTVAFSGSYNDLSDKPTIPTIPGVVSTSANGLAPKVTDTSKFLKGDGTWATPTDTNTTYTVATGDSAGQIKVTPSSGSAYNVDVKSIVKHLGDVAKSNMNDVGKLYPSVGMTALTDPGNTTDNPMNGTTKSTGWHLYWDTSYSDDPSGSNAWVAQIANKAGSNQWWVRSRAGGKITNGTAWTSPWRHLVTADVAGKGSATKPTYVDKNGDVQACAYTLGKSVPSDADFVKNTEYKILDNYLTSEFIVSGSTAQAYASTNVTLPAGTYLLITTTWGKVNGNGSVWLMTFIGGTEICNTLLSDNINMHQLIYFGVYTSSGAAARFELAASKGNATSVTIPPYEKYELRAIRLY